MPRQINWYPTSNACLSNHLSSYSHMNGISIYYECKICGSRGVKCNVNVDLDWLLRREPPIISHHRTDQELEERITELESRKITEADQPHD